MNYLFEQDPQVKQDKTVEYYAQLEKDHAEHTFNASRFEAMLPLLSEEVDPDTIDPVKCPLGISPRQRYQALLDQTNRRIHEVECLMAVTRPHLPDETGLTESISRIQVKQEAQIQG